MMFTTPFQKQKGFTIIEMTIVITILSFILLTTIKWPGKSINLNAQAQQLANDIRYVQFLAMSHDELYQITFGSNQYSLTPGFFPSSLMQENTITLEDGITLTTTNNNLVFDGKGIPYTDDTGTTLDEDASITLTIEGKTKTITITPETGKVTLS